MQCRRLCLLMQLWPPQHWQQLLWSPQLRVSVHCSAVVWKAQQLASYGLCTVTMVVTALGTTMVTASLADATMVVATLGVRARIRTISVVVALGATARGHRTAATAAPAACDHRLVLPVCASVLCC